MDDKKDLAMQGLFIMWMYIANSFYGMERTISSIISAKTPNNAAIKVELNTIFLLKMILLSVMGNFR